MRKKIIQGILGAVGVCAALICAFVLVLTFSEYQPKKEETIDLRRGRGLSREIYEGDQIDLLTWNIGYGGLDESMDSVLMGGLEETKVSKEQVSANMEAMIDWIGNQKYDVLFLQEVDRNSARSCGINEEELLVQRLGGVSMFAQNYRCLFVPESIRNPIGAVNGGIQTLTRLPADSAQRAALSNEYVWPARTWKRKYCALITRVPVRDSGRELILVNVQMAAYENIEDRQEQFKQLGDLLEAEYEQGNYVIVGGDFNQAFPDDDFRAYPIRTTEYFEMGKMVSTFKDWNWTFASDRSAPTSRLLNETYRSTKWWAQLYVMDGYILSPNVSLVEVNTINQYFKYSSHNPVKLTVVLEATPLRVQADEQSDS